MFVATEEVDTKLNYLETCHWYKIHWRCTCDDS